MEKAFHPILPIELGDGFMDDHRSKNKKFIHLSTKNLCTVLYFNKTLYKSRELNIYVFFLKAFEFVFQLYLC